MPNAIAFLCWFLIALLAGVLPGAWLIANGRWPVGVLAIVAGYVLGGLMAEGVVRVLEKPGKR